MLFIHPDVAAVKLRQLYRTPGGVDVGSPLFVMAEEDGRWPLTACQNTAASDDDPAAGDAPRPVFVTSD